MVTVYNQDSHKIGKVRVSRVITLGTLREKICDFFKLKDCASFDLKIGGCEKFLEHQGIFKGANYRQNRKIEANLRLFFDLKFDETTNLIGIKANSATYLGSNSQKNACS